MEALYLLFSIGSTFITSLALSLLLLLRNLLTRLRFFRSIPPPSANAAFHSHSIYEGTVWHDRRHPVRHSFSYSVRYAFLDLDNLSCPQPGHLSAEEARQKVETTGPVFLLTIPPSVGYEQNPLSVYYCYDLEGSILHLKKCIAEVTNTPWGERVIFVFDPSSDLVAKPLHVSPFMDMLGNWRIRANAPGDSLSVFISVQHPELGDYFVATLKAKRISLSLGSDHGLFFWLMPHKVAFWIYWQALQLWWKNVPYIQHPRYCNPKYREEAMARDQKLQCNLELAQVEDKYLQDGFCPGSFSGRIYKERQFKWRDAKWPWG
ncbi:uncharacterized protein LOC110604557 [Manihot esculenta]|uniref:DUF1365 domain-containing protein n=3 Tax=Manihot esculenta TaxID=3983 RepID=A0A251JAN8_MANES|nr:uncharacterized protein LOC110604557 [Manihot esculenta]XP_043808187.1 uncharacterized protein LOC110604557 [Manihot esculenta]KAG8634688.1 hypothetical protein MANES_17G071500v8 [Manihot esculenta]KAG8634689.1 hypothetical protein MANES_17G071500v8 [Manihot esculenta]OAY25159.1 hypothetical protein MANES_17G071500v8 [Manihot esculenta]OAY25160.1 hypothetical protein MANES_17G071500v8 [Manihot esculenta]